MSESAELTFGGRIRVIRKGMGLTVEQFSALCGVTKRSQSLYENDKRKPSMTYIENLLNNGVDVVYIITGKIHNYKDLSDEERLIIDIFRNERFPVSKK